VPSNGRLSHQAKISWFSVLSVEMFQAHYSIILLNSSNDEALTAELAAGKEGYDLPVQHWSPTPINRCN